MENQTDKPLEEALSKLRKDIDDIDEQIISLLEKRLGIVEKVGSLKSSYKEDFFIRSAREADMIKNLVRRSEKFFPNSVIASIWRKIITTSNLKEQEIQVALHNPKNIPDYSY